MTVDNCNPCNTSVEVVSLIPNCTPIPPCASGCDQTHNAKCITYTGTQSLADMGVVSSTPELEDILQKYRIKILEASAGLSTIVVKNEGFQVSLSDKVYLLKGGTSNSSIIRTITLPDATTLTAGKTWKFIYHWVANNSWAFNPGISYGLASTQTNITTMVGSPSALGTTPLKSITLTVIFNGTNNEYVVYE